MHFLSLHRLVAPMAEYSDNEDPDHTRHAPAKVLAWPACLVMCERVVMVCFLLCFRVPTSLVDPNPSVNYFVSPPAISGS